MAEKTMQKESAFASGKDYIATADFAQRAFFNFSNRTGPDRGQHALSVSSQANLSAKRQGLGYQGRTLLAANLRPDPHGWRLQEVFLEEPQLGCAGETFPQMSAIVSKTRSKRNAGF
jgi:hypothetical protein